MTKQKVGPAVDDQVEAIAITPRQACRLLAIGNTRLYQLISKGELQTYLDGRARRVVLASIHRYVTQRLADAGATGLPFKTRRLSSPDGYPK